MKIHKIKVLEWDQLSSIALEDHFTNLLTFEDGSLFTVEMRSFCGEVIEVRELSNNPTYDFILSENYGGWMFSKCMYEPFKEHNRNGANSNE